MSLSRSDSPHSLRSSSSTDSLENLFSDVQIGGQPIPMSSIHIRSDVPAQVTPPADLQSQAGVSASQLLAKAPKTLDQDELQGATGGETPHNTEHHATLLINIIKYLTDETIPLPFLSSMFEPEMYLSIYEDLNKMLDTPNEKFLLRTLNAYTISGKFMQEMKVISSFEKYINSSAKDKPEIDEHAASFEMLYQLLSSAITDFSREEQGILVKADSCEILHYELSKISMKDNVNQILAVLNTHSYSGNFMRSLFELRR